jgi:hypothetical protein
VPQNLPQRKLGHFESICKLLVRKDLDGGGTGIRTPDTWIMIPKTQSCSTVQNRASDRSIKHLHRPHLRQSCTIMQQVCAAVYRKSTGGNHLGHVDQNELDPKLSRSPWLHVYRESTGSNYLEHVDQGALDPPDCGEAHGFMSTESLPGDPFPRASVRRSLPKGLRMMYCATRSSPAAS